MKVELNDIIYLLNNNDCDLITASEGSYIVLDQSLENRSHIYVAPYEDGEALRMWGGWTDVKYFVSESEYLSTKREDSINLLLQ